MVGSSALYEAILKGDKAMADAVTQEALRSGIEAQELVEKHMIPAMDEVGRLFQTGEYFVPELLIASRAMKAALVYIRPLLAASGGKPVGRVVIGTVKGDLHDIGKNLVAAMLEGAGFEVTDLGVDVGPEKFAAAIVDAHADIVCLSALLTTTMPSMKTAVEVLEGSGVRDRVKILVGGAPITEEYAREIGADGYGQDASGAVTLARQLMSDAGPA